ncbi:MarR family transcriptional regulator [Frigoribacterium sp. UYMn621]|uniref:MarR family winged helix-turn-helix transcriptional regulator n=1 Tax=Frigoribacterium sp. UYMn621 TaxID=3156343 RepID=UPI003395E2F5
MTATAASAPRLDEQICFALYSASRALTARYRELLAPLGVTYPQYLVLMVLWERDAITVSELGERLQLDSGTLSPLIRRLESAGLVIRTRRSDDERAVEVTLSPAGAALQERSAGIPDQICAATGFDLEHIAALQSQVTELAAQVRGSR